MNSVVDSRQLNEQSVHLRTETLYKIIRRNINKQNQPETPRAWYSQDPQSQVGEPQMGGESQWQRFSPRTEGPNSVTGSPVQGFYTGKMRHRNIWLWRPVRLATYSSILAWEIPWMDKPGRLQSMGLQRVGHNWTTSHTIHTRLTYGRTRGLQGKETLLLKCTCKISYTLRSIHLKTAWVKPTCWSWSAYWWGRGQLNSPWEHRCWWQPFWGVCSTRMILVLASSILESALYAISAWICLCLADWHQS